MSIFAHPDRFETRHIGPREDDIEAMLGHLWFANLDQHRQRRTRRYSQ